jgi:hypothetical protein
MEKVIFDTNGYRDLVANKTDKQIEKILQRLKDREDKNQIQSLISPIVAKELLAHLADKSDPSFEKCLKANKALYLHSGSNESYRMIASPELLISKAFWNKEIPAKIETNKAFGQISYHLATNPTEYTFSKFQRNLNLNRDHVLDSEINFANAMLQFVRNADPNSTSWRPFATDDKNREKLLASIRSDSTSLDIAAGYLVIVHQLLYASGQVETISYNELFDMAVEFVRIFPEPIALFKAVMENLVNSDFNLLENSRSNFVWDIHLMFNIGKHSIAGDKLHFVTSDKAIIRTALGTDAKYSIWTFNEYMEYLKS